MVWIIVAMPVLGFLAGMFLDGRTSVAVPFAFGVLLASFGSTPPATQFAATTLLIALFTGVFVAGGFQIRALMRRGSPQRAVAVAVAGAGDPGVRGPVRVALAGCFTVALLAIQVWPAPTFAPPAPWIPEEPVERRQPEMAIRVIDQQCLSGDISSIPGRIDRVKVRDTRDAVILTILLRPEPGDHECPGHPPSRPVRVDLDRPIGRRGVIDGDSNTLRVAPLDPAVRRRLMARGVQLPPVTQ
jgi:hypothetical protein